jgi:hypothetical protein
MTDYSICPECHKALCKCIDLSQSRMHFRCRECGRYHVHGWLQFWTCTGEARVVRPPRAWRHMDEEG